MNKVKLFWRDSMFDIERDINKFAEKYEIINISLVTDTSRMGTYGYKALVLYKSKGIA